MQLRILKNMKGRVLCSTVSKYHYREVETSASRAFVPTMEYEIQMLHQVQNLYPSYPNQKDWLMLILNSGLLGWEV